MSDLITFIDGWQLTSLTRTPLGYECVIEKSCSVEFYPHYVTRFKRGSGRSQREALQAATASRGYAHESTVYGASEHAGRTVEAA